MTIFYDPFAQNLVKNLKYHSGSSVSDYMKNNFVAFKLYTVAVVEWLRHTGNAELLFETRVHLPRLLLITLMSGDQLYFSKGDPFCFALFRSLKNERKQKMNQMASPQV